MRRWSKAEGDRILDILRGMQGAPFAQTVAQLAGITPRALGDWITLGLNAAEHDETADSDRAAFALEFRRIQAAWIDRATQRMSKPEQTKEEANGTRSLQWVLERLQREVFDLSRAPKEAPKGDSEKPPQTRKAGAKAAASLLEKPDEPPLQ